MHGAVLDGGVGLILLVLLGHATRGRLNMSRSLFFFVAVHGPQKGQDFSGDGIRFIGLSRKKTTWNWRGIFFAAYSAR